MTTARIPTHLDSVLSRGASGSQVRQIQEMLNLAGSHPRLPTTGFYGEMTEKSVRSFQASKGLGVDGKVGPKTFEALERAVRSKQTTDNGTPPKTNPGTNQGGESPPTTTAPNGDFCFPFSFRPSPDWKGGGRYFGAPRDGGRRLHAGCDLLAPRGTPIYAVSDGTLIRGPYPFYSGTDAVEIRHGNFIVRYGEIMPGSYIGGSHVRKGQQICKVGRLESGSSMLHFELYTNGANTRDSLTGGGPYRRRSDVTNASPYLDQWVHNLPHS